MTNAEPTYPWYIQLIVALGLILSALAVLVFGYAIVLQISPPYEYPERTDFSQEWTSGRNHFTGRPIYDDMRVTVPLHINAPPPPLVTVNAHPPASVWTLLPLARLDFDRALFQWHLISLGSLFVSLLLICTASGIRFSPLAIFPVTLLVVTSGALFSQLSMGQLNLVLLLMFVLAWMADRLGGSIVAGAIIGAAAAFKLFPAFLFIYFLVRRQWAALAAGALAFVGINAAAATVLGVESYSDYLFDVLPQVGAYRDFWVNSSVAGFWSKLLDAPSGHAVPLWKSPTTAKIATLLSWALIVAITSRTIARAETRDQRDRAFALCVTAMLLVSPITWDHYFLMLILPILVLWKVVAPGWLARGFLLVVIFALGTINPAAIWNHAIAGDGELVTDPQLVRSIAEPWQTLTLLSYQFYALLALFLFAWRARLRNADVEPQATPS